MGKDTKELLKTILANTEAIMAHLQLKQTTEKPKNKQAAPVKKSASKKSGNKV